LEKDIILHGVHIGEHGFVPEQIISEIQTRCIDRGLNYAVIRTRSTPIPQELFLQWAEFLAENKIYFSFLYTVQHAPAGRDSQFDAATVAKMKEIAGPYFLGDMIGETGSSCGCKAAGYFDPKQKLDNTRICTDYADMKEAHDGILSTVSAYIRVNNALGMSNTIAAEATALCRYNLEAGATIPVLEMMCGDPEVLIAAVRGAAKAYGCKLWGTYIAHEWYGGMRHADPLKRKRLELAYKYAYLAGSKIFCLESGDEGILSYAQQYGQTSDLCGDYRNVLRDMAELIRVDVRPKTGPKVKLAFVQGLHDAWGGWGGSSLWNQFHREEWGHSHAEHSWSLLSELGTKRPWSDPANYGDEDLSATAACGQYDIVPIEAGLDILKQYDCLIFLGWHTMTEETMDKLTAYTENGGHLLMCAAHLNGSVKRDGSFEPVSNEKIQRLFGAQYTGKLRSTNDGVKFLPTSLTDGILYPGTANQICDPLYSHGYIRYAEFSLCGGTAAARVSDSFLSAFCDIHGVIEHKVGRGTATLVAAADYPGHPAVLPLYRAVVRAFITAGARACGLRVLGGDRLRWSVYEGNIVYLLNTDYDVPVTAKITDGSLTRTVTLQPLELKRVEMSNGLR